MTAYGAIKTAAPMSGHPTGYDLLRDPRLNKGTAFTEAERRAFRLEGLLPPAVTTMALQVARRHAEIAALADDLQKYLVLSDLQERNETLYYAILMSDPAAYMPLVYTPTVGDACQRFAHIFRQARGMYFARHRARPARGPALQLAGKGRTLHRRHRWRAHSRSRRSRRRRHGYPDRQALALYRVRRRAAATLSADRSRRRHQQSGPARRSALSGPAPAPRPRRRIFGFRRRVRRRRAAPLPEMLHPVGGFRQFQRRPHPRALSRQDLHLQRRHPGHRRRRARWHLRRHAPQRRKACRAALSVPRRG